jgi:hypothetical protein
VAPSSGDRQKVPSDKGFLSPGNWFHLSSDDDWKYWFKNESERSEGRRLVLDWFKKVWRPVLRTVPVSVETCLVVCRKTISYWNPMADCGCTESLMNHENTSATSIQSDAVKGEHQDGHTADRTNMLPWDSCGPDCPVCAECER